MSEEPTKAVKRVRKPKNHNAAVVDTGITDRMVDDTEVNIFPAPVLPEQSPFIPPCPPADPSLGMKTPEVVAWWFKNHPAAFKEKYSGLTYGVPEA